MGGVTPRFGIRFPYEGEVVDPTHFKNMADDIDTALTSVEALRTRALNRPTAKVQGPSGGSGATAVAPSTTTTLALGGGSSGSILWWDNDGMWNPAQTDRLTVKTAGVYGFNAHVSNSYTNATTLNSFELQAQVTGSLAHVFQHKQNTQNVVNPGRWQVSGVWLFAVNDYVQVKAFWSGTGSLTPTAVTLEMHLISLA